MTPRFLFSPVLTNTEQFPSAWNKKSSHTRDITTPKELPSVYKTICLFDKRKHLGQKSKNRKLIPSAFIVLWNPGADSSIFGPQPAA